MQQELKRAVFLIPITRWVCSLEKWKLTKLVTLSSPMSPTHWDENSRHTSSSNSFKPPPKWKYSKPPLILRKEPRASTMTKTASSQGYRVVQYMQISKCNLPHGLKGRDHIIISLDAERAFNNIQNLSIIIQNLSKLRTHLLFHFPTTTWILTKRSKISIGERKQHIQ